MISLLVPTRNRPDLVRRMWDSARATALGEIEACFYLDDDDPVGLQGVESLGGDWAATVGERCVLSEAWNRAFEIADGDILMHASDDIIFRSQGWDLLVTEELERFSDRIAFVYGRDGYQDEQLGTHGFVSREWVEALGYFVPPYFSSDYNDLWLHEVAGLIGRRVFVPEVFIEHMHPVAGKGEWDLTHRERLERHQRDDPGALYERLETERQGDAEKLQAAMDDPDRLRGATSATVAPPPA